MPDQAVYRFSLDTSALVNPWGKVYQPDLLILDVMMPGITGFKVCDELRKIDEFKDTPVIFLTVMDIQLDEEWKKYSDENTYISKPFDTKDLAKRVMELLDE